MNQQTVLFDSPLLARNNTTFVPVRFVSEQFNASVEYLGSKKMVFSRIRQDEFWDSAENRTINEVNFIGGKGF